MRSACAGLLPRTGGRRFRRLAHPSVQQPLSTAVTPQNAPASAAEDIADPHTAAAAHCMSLVRERDREHYLAGTFVPPAARKAYFAVRALNVELCAIPVVTGGNAATAQLRVGWWKEAVDGMFEHGSVEVFPQHPVVTALTAAVAHHGLSQRPLQRLLEAREFDLTQAAADGFSSLAQMELYASQTAGAMIELTAECLARPREAGAAQGAAVPDEAREAARLAGVGTGMATLLRGTAHHVRVGQQYLPRCAMAGAGADARDLTVAAAGGHSCGGEHEDRRFESVERVKQVVKEVAAVARTRLADARALQQSVPIELRPALLPATLAENWLQRLEGGGYDVFDPQLNGGMDMKLYVKMWWRATTGAYL